MSNKNYSKDGIGLEKMRTLMQEPKIIMMATALEKIPFSVCPMTIQQIDDQGDLWFLTSRESDHFKDIEHDNRVQLIYSDEPNQKYLSMFGNATHIVDVQKVNQLWNNRLNEWFNGKKDPNVALLNVNIENAYYWDSGSQKLLSFFESGNAGLDEAATTTRNKGYINLQNH